MPQVFFELQMQKHLESRVCACATCTMLLVCKSVAFRVSSHSVCSVDTYECMYACRFASICACRYADMQASRNTVTHHPCVYACCLGLTGLELQVQVGTPWRCQNIHHRSELAKRDHLFNLCLLLAPISETAALSLELPGSGNAPESPGHSRRRRPSRAFTDIEACPRSCPH